ncbi:hypothetical protein TrCOL_g3920 [Triparma columacea]|uniref:Uncharacterized protein n=1 Tax=Triparma columacea TaxID=722753 RepID=A0A9W7G9P2_9STRA|nr:hypothetical protein TrCOL_g3920 [Triparma columacea]
MRTVCIKRGDVSGQVTILGCRHDSLQAKRDVRNLILSPPTPTTWDVCVLELDPDRWRNIRRNRISNEFTAALDAFLSLNPTPQKNNETIIDAYPKPRPRFVLADLPVKTLFSPYYLKSCFINRKPLQTSITSLSSSLTYALTIDPLPTVSLLILMSTLLSISFSNDFISTLISFPLVLLPIVSLYFNVLIFPRDANIARAVVREVEELGEGREGETVNVMCVVGGNHVDGIQRELEKYNNDEDNPG